MAKYQVTRSCGHEETVQLTGPHKAREYRLTKEAERLCGECFAEARRSNNAAAAAAAQEKDLPVLTGSPKQVAWAESIRQNAIAHMDRAIAYNAANPEERIMWSHFRSYLLQIASAKEWIDEIRDGVRRKDYDHKIRSVLYAVEDGKRTREEVIGYLEGEMVRLDKQIEGAVDAPRYGSSEIAYRQAICLATIEILREVSAEVSVEVSGG